MVGGVHLEDAFKAYETELATPTDRRDQVQDAVECVRQVLFDVFLLPLSALSPAQAPSVPLIRPGESARPPLFNVG